jgi:hypothetical protein
MDAGLLEQALSACGDLLAQQGERVRIVVVGGASLSLLGLVQRHTADVDVIARVETGSSAVTLIRAEPLPDALSQAVLRVARDFDLPPDWLNAEVGMQWSQGLPPGLERDLVWRTFGGLDVGLAGRRTLIALKLFAAADGGLRSVHLQDLIALRPCRTELTAASAWVVTQDASPMFPRIVAEVVEHVIASA